MRATDLIENQQRRDSTPAPIALFVYNRLAHAQRTVEALQRNELASESDLLVFSDGAKYAAERAAIENIRKFIKKLDGFRSVNVIERDRNIGLAKSIISGVSDVCATRGRVIVVEDDLLTAPSFLGYMNQALNLYEDDPSVGSIHGYWYPVEAQLPQSFFLRGASCWGWATWSRAWKSFEPEGQALLLQMERRKLTRAFDLDGAMPYTAMLRSQIAGKVDSWAIRWHASMFLAGKFQLSPSGSLVSNIGFDGSGMHRVLSNAYDVSLSSFDGCLQRVSTEECSEARAALIRYYRNRRRNLIARLFGRIRR